MIKKMLFVSVCITILGASLSGCTLWRAENKPPIASFTAFPDKVNVCEEIFFSANESTDPDGKIVKYHWDFGDGSYSYGKEVTHVYNSYGNYTVSLVVTDNEGAKDSFNTTVKVNAYPISSPYSNISTVRVFYPVKFFGDKSIDPDGRIVDYIWDFGDGTNASGVQVEHVYKNMGIYTVNLTVIDDFGAKSTESIEIEIIPRTFSIIFEETRHTLPSISQYSRENTTYTETINLDAKNITKTVIKLSWKDDIYNPLTGYNDLFKFTVDDPQDNRMYLEGTLGNITMEFTYTKVPPKKTVKCRTYEEAMMFIGDNYTSADGSGEWQINVTLGECGGYQSILHQNIDFGNNWKIEIEYWTYKAKVIEVS